MRCAAGSEESGRLTRPLRSLIVMTGARSPVGRRDDGPGAGQPRRVIKASEPGKDEPIIVRVPLGPPAATVATYRELLAILVELTRVELLDDQRQGGPDDRRDR